MLQRFASLRISCWGTVWGVAFASAPAIMPLSAGRRGWRGAARHDAAWCMADAPVKLPAARRCDASRRAAVSCNPARQPWQSGVPRRWMRAEDLGVVGAGFRDQGWRGGREGVWRARGTCLWRRGSRLGGRESRFPVCGHRRQDAHRFATVARAELRSTVDPDTHLGWFRDVKVHIFWMV